MRYVGCALVLLLLGCAKGGEAPALHGQCVKVNSGAKRQVTLNDFGFVSAFQLEQTETTQYRIRLNLRFTVEGASDNEAVEEMKLATGQCLAKASKHLLGPNGERLELELVSSASGVREVTIPVTRNPVRGHAQLWKVGWSCPEILHEVGHVLGLVDEYPEPEGRWDCRVEGPKTSLMYSPQRAFEAVEAGDRESLLFPAQFRVITSPGCADTSGTYYQCAANAYKSSAPGAACAPVPEACRNGSTDWLD